MGQMKAVVKVEFNCHDVLRLRKIDIFLSINPSRLIQFPIPLSIPGVGGDDDSDCVTVALSLLDESTPEANGTTRNPKLVAHI
ncbi:uncharacterized protein G2W53_014514 [Senna tora]|uniref:Uncharacterized protein n=1 Tax=Senna tora TaxID=362788 RepID=A0A835C2R2_9FABA|nr:uncharacterized protein G2W53_014514 [Senna tora]